VIAVDCSHSVTNRDQISLLTLCKDYGRSGRNVLGLIIFIEISLRQKLFNGRAPLGRLGDYSMGVKKVQQQNLSLRHMSDSLMI